MALSEQSIPSGATLDEQSTLGDNVGESILEDQPLELGQLESDFLLNEETISAQ